jgi:brefeldin A-resistance guanine nucleotide exchange factor 1
MFNSKPKNGLPFLESNGIIVPDETGGSDEERRLKGIARFLKTSSRLDKKLLGEYISSPDRLGLLKAFIGLFDFRGVSVSLRSTIIISDDRNLLPTLCESC